MGASTIRTLDGKGGLWVTYGNDPIRYVETGIGCINHIQLRPSPLDY
jgi:hypothetical protein